MVGVQPCAITGVQAKTCLEAEAQIKRVWRSLVGATANRSIFLCWQFFQLAVGPGPKHWALWRLYWHCDCQLWISDLWDLVQSLAEAFQIGCFLSVFGLLHECPIPVTGGGKGGHLLWCGPSSMLIAVSLPCGLPMRHNSGPPSQLQSLCISSLGQKMKKESYGICSNLDRGRVHLGGLNENRCQVKVPSEDQWHKVSLGWLANMQIPGPHLRLPASDSMRGSRKTHFKQTLPPLPTSWWPWGTLTFQRHYAVYNTFENYSFSKSFLSQLIFLNTGNVGPGRLLLILSTG